MIFKFACLHNIEYRNEQGELIQDYVADEWTVFAIVTKQNSEGVWIDRYIKYGKIHLCPAFLTYHEFNRYFSFGLWDFSEIN